MQPGYKFQSLRCAYNIHANYFYSPFATLYVTEFPKFTLWCNRTCTSGEEARLFIPTHYCYILYLFRRIVQRMYPLNSKNKIMSNKQNNLYDYELESNFKIKSLFGHNLIKCVAYKTRNVRYTQTCC